MAECSLLSIGNRIEALRKEKGITQQQLAKEFLVRREVVTKWETGLQDLKTDNIIKLADYFGVTCDYLLRGIKSENVDINKKLGLSEEAIEHFAQTKDSGDSEFSQAQDWLITNDILETMSFICINIKINSENFINQNIEHHKKGGMERALNCTNLYNAEDSCDVERYKLTKLMEYVANNFDKRCSESSQNP